MVNFLFLWVFNFAVVETHFITIFTCERTGFKKSSTVKLSQLEMQYKTVCIIWRILPVKTNMLCFIILCVIRDGMILNIIVERHTGIIRNIAKQ